MKTKADRRAALREGRIGFNDIGRVARSDHEMRQLYDLLAALERAERDAAGRCRECGAAPCAGWSTCPREEAS